MKSGNSCVNCGASNDLLLTTCLFCKSPLDRVNIESISDEILIQNAGEWIGKMGEEYIEPKENAKWWDGPVVVKESQIEGLAQRYLSLLQVRSINNEHLQPIYLDLKSRMDFKRSGFLYKLGISKNSAGMIGLFIIIITILILMGIFS